MKITRKKQVAALAVVVLAVLGVACEDTMDITAPKDGSIIVEAIPGRVVLDPNLPDPPRVGRFLIGYTDIQAQVFDKNGYPVANAVVYFSADSGSLVSDGPPRVGAPTDDNGFCGTKLQVIESGPSSVKVTARSGC